MTDKGCIDHPRCEDYNYYLNEFDKLGTWRGPMYEDWSNDPVRLRNWWDGHGCVRCLLVAGRKRAAGKWERVCREVGDNDYMMGNPELVEEIKAAVTSWNSRKSRLAGRYDCGKHTSSTLCGCALFDRFPVATEWGHTGWVYGIPPVWRAEFGDRSWKVGEETIRPDAQTGQGGDESDLGATSSMAELVEALRLQGWQKWKQLTAKNANFEEAFLRSMTHRQAWFTPLSNNCNSSAYDVLVGFGADHMPQPGPDDGDRGYAIGHLFGAIDSPAIDLWPELADDRGDGAEPAPAPAPAPSRIRERAAGFEAMRGSSATGSWDRLVAARTAAPPGPPMRFQPPPPPAMADPCRTSAAVLPPKPPKGATADKATATLQRLADRQARFKVDGRKVRDAGAEPMAALVAGFTPGMRKEFMAKAATALRDAAQRSAMNGLPQVSAKDRMKLIPVLDIDTKVEWVSVDWA